MSKEKRRRSVEQEASHIVTVKRKAMLTHKYSSARNERLIDKRGGTVSATGSVSAGTSSRW